MLIQFKNVTVIRDERSVLQELACDLSEHRIGILGSNGSGKSTLLRLINGLTLAGTGQVILDGLENPDNQLVLPVVGEDIDLGLRRLIADRSARAQAVRDALSMVACEHLIDRVVHTLSGGEKQLVALAAVLATSPEIILFDEPTTQLDLKNARRFARMLAELPQPCVVVSHDLALMQTMDRVLVIDQALHMTQTNQAAEKSWLERQRAGVIILLFSAGLITKKLWQSARSFLGLIVMIFVYSAWLQGWELASVTGLRMLSLLLLALALSWTTPVSALMGVVQTCLKPLDRLGWVNSATISLTFGLTLRMIPELSLQWREIREAQMARGLDRHVLICVRKISQTQLMSGK
eukprot:gene3905-3954_t